MKFVHAADIHLDSPLRGLDKYDGAPVGQMRTATRRALENLVRLCIDEAAELLLIAGDLYDGDWPDYNTGLFFAAQMTKLRTTGVRVVLVRGNHDAKSKLTRSLRLPDGVYDLSTHRAETVRFEDLGISVHGRGYENAETTENLVLGYPRADGGLFNIGLLHTCADGRAGHAPYAPCSRDEMLAKGYEYWALGHVHRREVLHDAPWVVFPGNLQGRHAQETGPKGATLVTVEDGHLTAIEHRAVDVVRWAQCTVDVSGETTVDAVLGLVERTLRRAAQAAGGRSLAARVVLQGESAVHAALASSPERFRHEVRAAATEAGDVWVEKVVVETRPPLDLDALAQRDGALGSLVRALRALRADEGALLALREHVVDLERKLPAEFRVLDDAFAFDSPSAYRAALEDIERTLVPELLAEVGA